MRINNNIVAMRTNQNLRASDKALDKSINRLSSGIKLTQAKDDPASFAIVKRLSAQIAGLDQGKSNAGDGISAIQTAESTLSEIQSMLQRMNELSVQAANDTNDPLDRKTIQNEITELKNEINRIAETTDYNGRILLDGGTERNNYVQTADGKLASKTKMLSLSTAVDPGEYQFKITRDPEQATVTLGAAQPGVFSLNGEEIEIFASDIPDRANAKIQELCDRTNITYSNEGGNIKLTSLAYGKDVKITAKMNDTVYEDEGVDAQATYTTSNNGFNNNAEVSVEGNIVTFKNSDGFELKVETSKGSAAEGVMTSKVLDAGTMIIQNGCNEGDELELIFSKVSTKTLEIDEINVRSYEGAQQAIEKVSAAISQVSQMRSKMGAYENRLEYSSNNLSEESEKITDALSRINDTDMAAEMTEYTQKNVLSQATSTILAKANQRPEMVLQLLQS